MNYALFRKPSRYIGHELNAVVRNGDVKIALCFPDSYEIGMSHIGLRVLYSIINTIPGAAAERVYAPWVDLEAYLREKGLPLRSIEHQRPLREFHIVGFTLQYELSYTNVLNMLDLGGITLRSRERGEDEPLVIAGGPCTVNPLPLAPFIDAFVIGDGEEVIIEIIDAYRNVSGYRSAVSSREKLLAALAKLEGVYVPAIHDRAGKTVKRRIVEDLDRAPFPDAPILPYMGIVHDRVAIEISRGCTRGCRFCQAGMIYRPLRERSPENVLSLASRSIANTGYEEISFTSLSTGDYSSLLPLITDFHALCSGTRTSVSLPSLRVGAVSRDVLRAIKSVRKTGFTIAPEAGTERLRRVINKDFTAEEYTSTLGKLFEEGWNSIKLYFMIGLPTEQMSDIDGLIDMAVLAAKKGREITGKRPNVNVSISPFVPKAHTPFQWSGLHAMEELREKQDYIRRAFRKRGINFKGQHVEQSLVEAVFARAGREGARLLESAWKRGCRFDGWSEFFDFSTWTAAAGEAGIDLGAYASRSFGTGDVLPWDFIATGITGAYLKREYERAVAENRTADCLTSCHGCGLSCSERVTHRTAGTARETETGRPGVPDLRPLSGPNVPGRIRVNFSKTGMLRYLSHQEVMNAILRALRRARIPVAYSAGFHPHPKVSFGPALPSGVEGTNEFFDVETTALVTPGDLLKRLGSCMPAGLRARSASPVPLHGKAISDGLSCYEYEVLIDKASDDAIHSFMSRREWPVAREKKTVDIRPMVEKALISGDRMVLVLRDRENAKVRLYEVLREMLQKPMEEILTLPVKRTGFTPQGRVSQACAPG